MYESLQNTEYQSLPSDDSDGVFKKINNTETVKHIAPISEIEKCFSEVSMPGSRACFYVSNMRGIIPNTNNQVYSTPYFFMFKQSFKQNKQEKLFIPLKYLRKTNEIISEMVAKNEKNIDYIM